MQLLPGFCQASIIGPDFRTLGRVLSNQSPFPSVDRMLNLSAMQPVIARFGRTRTVAALHTVLDEARAVWRNDASNSLSEEDAVVRCTDLLEGSVALTHARPIQLN